jgi:hypothetical protein
MSSVNVNAAGREEPIRKKIKKIKIQGPLDFA